MWRSNALHVRIRSSRVGIQHARIWKKWYSVREKALPISDEEFSEALEYVSKLKSFQGSRQRKIGLAVSGGVDSMALATLLMRRLAIRAGDSDSLYRECNGFIIDHKMRPESTEEAEWVAQQLRLKLGMESSVIPLAWPSDADPNRFESDARTLRYQALGKACRQHMIQWLMVAHHANDQAETVMARILNMRHRSGLQGIHKIMPIPECYGIHGVHNSGDLELPRKHYLPGGQESYESGHKAPFPVESGGVLLLRPLLGFEKNRLVATCQEHGIPWAEDKTNQDKTLTERNAIRHILNNHELPAALSPRSLVKLSEHMQERIEERSAYVDAHLVQHTKLKLDVQTGSLTVRLPPTEALLDRPIKSPKDVVLARDHALFLINRLVECVTPYSKVNLDSMVSKIPRFYPGLFPKDDENTSLRKSEAQNFCVSGVWVKGWTGSSLFGSETTHNEWIIQRQPLSIREEKSATREKCIVFPASLPRTDIKTDIKTAPWHFFDGRFWFRLINHTHRDIVLRCITLKEIHRTKYREPQIQVIIDKNNRSESDNHAYHDAYERIRVALGLIQPPDLRRGLPALFLRSKKPRADGAYEETLIALPTLNAVANFSALRPRPCTWEVRYKKVDHGSLQPQNFIVPGIQYSDIASRSSNKAGNKVELFIQKMQQFTKKVELSMNKIELSVSKIERSLSKMERSAKMTGQALDKVEQAMKKIEWSMKTVEQSVRTVERRKISKSSPMFPRSG